MTTLHPPPDAGPETGATVPSHPPPRHGGVSHEFGAILTIAYRDVLRFARDRARFLSELIFPMFFVIGFSAGFQNSLGTALGIDFPAFVVTGVLAQTLFQSSALGLVWLIDDRGNNFSQEIFVSPISRYSIIFGKLLGEGFVALLQAIPIILVSLFLGVRYDASQLALLVVACVLAVSLGGAFGLIILSNLNTRQAAQNIFAFIMLPQYFVAGVFVPVSTFPEWLQAISWISPMRYAVDIVRAAYFQSPQEAAIVLAAPIQLTLLVGAVFFAVCMVLGTTLFVRRERNR